MIDNLSYLLESGMSIEEIERARHKHDFSVEEIAEAEKSLRARGESCVEGWDVPLPFDSAELPAFPTEKLPHPMSAFVECLAASTHTPEEMAGTLGLGVLAACLQDKGDIAVTSDWREPLCLYTAVVAPPASRKSAVLSAVTRPVQEYERRRRKEEQGEIARNQAERGMLEKELQAAQNRAAKSPEAHDEVLELSTALANFQDKAPYRLLVDDTTTEKLIDLMAGQGGSIAVSSAEGGIFDIMAGRYDRSANIDVYLKGHAGDPVTVDRIGRPPNHIPAPRLSMILAVQPNVLDGLMGNDRFRGRGLCGRFLYAICNPTPDLGENDPPPIPEAVKAAYRDFVLHLLELPGGVELQLDPEASRFRRQYEISVNKRLYDAWEGMQDWGGKLTGAMLRIAALLHLSSFPAEVPLSMETVSAAVALAEFYAAHAARTYQILGADKTQEEARYLWRRISSTGETEIRRRDLFDICKGKFRTVEAMEPALRRLGDMGYVREDEIVTGGRGRPSTIVTVNPLAKK